ncbi:MAG: tyrosine-type recombinase/integrase [Solirubrobacteraceae bacterium]
MSAPIRRRLEPGIFERVDADGRRLGLEIAWKASDGKPRRRSVADNLHDARDALALARGRRARREAEPADARTTLSAVIDAFELAHAGQRSSTRAVRRSAFARIRPALGHKRISAIKRADVRAFVSSEIEAGYKFNTVRSHYSTLRAVFSFAASDLDIPIVFPALKPGELPDPADDQREHRVLTDDELARVLAACDDRGRLFVRTLAETGCRVSEVLGLTPQRIGDGTVMIEHQLGRDGRLRPLKSRHSRRTIEITRALAAELKLAGNRELVFPMLNREAARWLWASVLERAELEPPQPVMHDLRHTHASRLIAAGWDPVEVAKRIGDRIETVLSTYAHEFDSRRRSAERRAALEGLYGEQSPPATADVVPLRR